MTDAALQQAVATLQFLHDPGAVFELCIIGAKAPTGPWEGKAFGHKPIVAGWFKDPDKAARLALSIKAEGIYTTLNACREALLGRAHERLKAGAARTADKDIARLTNLLLDLDPIRPQGISSSDPEHEAALALAGEIREDLAAGGWPEPLTGDSGNGAHLIYPLDLDNTSENVKLLKAVLAGLARRYESRLADSQVELDLTVFNPSRLTKLYGTVAAKGDNLPERPHRRARIVILPEKRLALAPELLRQLAASLPADSSGASGATPANPAQKTQAADSGRFDLPAYLAHYGVEVVKVKEHGGGQLHCLAACLFDPGHRNNEAAIGQTAEGKLYYQCFHNSCKGRTWAEARQSISGGDNLKEFVAGAPARRSRKKKAGPEAPAITGSFSWSDLGNARRLVAKHGRDLKYMHLNKEWYYWTGKVWQVDNCGEAVRRAKDTIREIYAEGMAQKDLDRRADYLKFALKSEGAQRIKGMLELAQSEPGIPVLPDQLDADPWLFNCDNGTILLRGGKLQPHRREDLLTCLSPVAYDPQATYAEFENFLYQILNYNQNLVDFLWMSFGYALTGKTSEQCFWFFWGNGANGKGTLIDSISNIFGSYWMNISTETLLANQNAGSQIRSDVARLDGPRLVTAAEIDKGRRLSESLIKGLTGNDTITARFLYGKDFDFIPQFKLFVQTNNKPIIRDQTNAMWRRLKLVEFPMDFRANPDRELPDRLEAESPGILAWLVRGCLEWQRCKGLEEPDEVKEAVQEYRAEMDPLKEFIETKCLVGEGLTVTAADLYRAYNSWADENDLQKKERLLKRSFGLALAELGFRKAKGTGGVRLWRGLGLRSLA